MYTNKKYLLLLFYILNTTLYSQINNDKFIDSAEVYYPHEPVKSDSFLRLIPTPIENNLTDTLIAEYYYLLAKIDIDLTREAASFKNYILAVSYAEENGNHSLVAKTSYWLSSRLYIKGNDSLGNIYLEKSKKYYTSTNNQSGLLDILQMPAYQEYAKYNPSKSNELILENIAQYRGFTDNGYHYMFANFMLTSNYLELGNIKSANQSHKIFESLSTDTTVEKTTFNYFQALLCNSYVAYYLDEENIDSCLYYLNKVETLHTNQDYSIMLDLYLFYIDVYKLSGDTEKAIVYLDSLTSLQKKILKNTVEVNIDINQIILQKENELSIQKNNKENYQNIAIILITTTIVLILIFIIYKRKKRLEIDTFISKLNNYELLNNNQNKLKIKLAALEDYIQFLKEDIRTISMLNSKLQQKKINELYNKLNIKSSSLSRNGSHLDLVNKLNADFFIEVKKRHPKLNEGEIVVCYYVFIGLKNNEIATFLNSTIRAVESKRFRIAKKINLDTSISTLFEYLSSNFENIQAE